MFLFSFHFSLWQTKTYKYQHKVINFTYCISLQVTCCCILYSRDSKVSFFLSSSKATAVICIWTHVNNIWIFVETKERVCHKNITFIMAKVLYFFFWQNNNFRCFLLFYAITKNSIRETFSFLQNFWKCIFFSLSKKFYGCYQIYCNTSKYCWQYLIFVRNKRK